MSSGGSSNRRSSTTSNRHATGPSTPGHVASDVGSRSVLPILQPGQPQPTRRMSKSGQSVTSSNSSKTRSGAIPLMLALHPAESPPGLSPPAISPSDSSSDPSSPSAGGGGFMDRIRRMRGSISSQGAPGSEPPNANPGSMPAQWPNDSEFSLGVGVIHGRNSYDNFDQRTISNMSTYTTSSSSNNSTSSGMQRSIPSYMSSYTLDPELQSITSMSPGSYADHRSVRSYQSRPDWASVTSKGGSSETLGLSIAESEGNQCYSGSDPRASSIYLDPWERNR